MAANPEGNCHEKCQQLGDGNGKPDAIRAEPQGQDDNGDKFENNGLEQGNDGGNEAVVQCREKCGTIHTEAVQKEG